MKSSIIIEKNISFKELLYGIKVIVRVVLAALGIAGLIGGYFFLIFKINELFFNSGVISGIALFCTSIIITSLIIKLYGFNYEKKYLPLRYKPDAKTCKLIYLRISNWNYVNKENYLYRKYYNEKIKMEDIIKRLSWHDDFNDVEINFINEIFYHNRPTINLLLFKIKFMGAYKDYKILDVEEVSKNMFFKEHNSKDINDKGGIYFGINKNTGNPIYYDKGKSGSGHELILGNRDSSKSYICGAELKNIYENTTDAIIVIQDNGVDELRNKCLYSTLAESYGEKHIKASECCINPFLLCENDKDGFMDKQEDLNHKYEFIINFISSVVKLDLSAMQKSLIANKIKELYMDNDEKNIPTISQLISKLETIKELKDVTEMLDRKLKIYNFENENKIDLSSRFIVFNMNGIYKGEYPKMMLMLLEFIFNSTYSNMKKGITTHIVIDNLSDKILGNEWVCNALVAMFKRFRKLWGRITLVGCTEDLLNNEYGQHMFNNASIIRLMKQSEEGIRLINNHLNIPGTIMNELKSGEGILIDSETAIPFLYKEQN